MKCNICGKPYDVGVNLDKHLTTYPMPACDCQRLDLLDQVRLAQPMGVSQWKAYGKKYGYWDYFKKEILNEQHI